MVNHIASGSIDIMDVTRPDVLVYDKTVTITIDLRGVEDTSRVSWEFVNDETLRIIYFIGTQKIVRQILIPVKVKPETARFSFVNNVLDIEVDRQNEWTPQHLESSDSLQ